jgi:hypothetical protein
MMARGDAISLQPLVFPLAEADSAPAAVYRPPSFRIPLLARAIDA